MKASRLKIIVEKGHALAGREIGLYERPKTGNLIPCPGEAHGNVFIDNCAVCAPRWGQVEERAPMDLATVRGGTLAISTTDLTNDEIRREEREHGAKILSVRTVVRRTGAMLSAFSVLAYPTLQALD